MAKYRKKPVVIEAFQYDGDLKGSDGNYYVPDWAVKAFEEGIMFYDSLSGREEPCEMNLLEHYIKEIISVEDVTKEWEDFMRKDDPNFVENDSMLKVEMIVSCYYSNMIYGTIKILHKSEWDKIQEQGYYYMA